MHYLSQNRPNGSTMGMGHYERLLLDGLRALDEAEGWEFRVTFDGRAKRRRPKVNRAADDPFAGASSLGFSSSRLRRLPLPLNRAVTGLLLGGRRPDLCHLLALSLPAPSGVPYVVTVHDLPPLRFADEGALPSWAARSARGARAIITPSEFGKREIVELLGVPGDKVHVVANGCPHDAFHPAVAPAGPDALARLGIGGPFLLYVGGFTRRKNVPALLQAWRQVAPSHPELSLVLAGPADRLRALAEQHPAPRVKVAGYLDHATLPGVMKAAAALVVPSIYEGFGLPPLEAMALGVPVVAVRGSAITEVVGDAGILAENGDADCLAAAIHWLLEDSELAAGLRARGPRRAERFSWSDHTRQVLGLYQQILA
ncbi:MAG: glycosyltransferase family 4 protein [Gluconacetobacter diazotrophicus]|nr:glycosyltransferase family 4 protein [Gluconacetobacter diazotrophicus]